MVPSDTGDMKTPVVPIPSLRVSVSALAGAAVALQVADLASFLLAVRLHPVLLDFEIGIIKTTYLEGGPLAAIAFKLAGIAVILAALAVYGGRWTRLILLATAVVGAVGAYANVTSLAAVSHLVD